MPSVISTAALAAPYRTIRSWARSRIQRGSDRDPCRSCLSFPSPTRREAQHPDEGASGLPQYAREERVTCG